MLSNFTADIEAQFKINPKELARGSFGFVNEAWRKSDNLHVAIKTMIDNSIDLTTSKNLLRELQLLANINHPKCLRLVAFTLAPVPKIVTPFMGNGTLNDVIVKLNEKRPDPNFTPTKMMCSVYGICSTMHFLHEKSIIHRDFKPLNVFLDDKYDICIADFGLSRKVEENVYMTMNNIGSPLYMAPELFTDEYETYTNKIDVYSFGVSYLQYFAKLEVLNDKKGKIRSQQNLMMRISKGARFPKPETANDDQYDIYTNCTLPNPNERPSFDYLCELFEKEKSLWFDGVDEKEYLDYVKECKSIIDNLIPKKEAQPAPQSEDEHKKIDERESTTTTTTTSMSSSSTSSMNSLSLSLTGSSMSSSKLGSSGKKHKRY